MNSIKLSNFTLDMVQEFIKTKHLSDHLIISLVPKPKKRLTLDSGGFYEVVISVAEPIAYGVVIQLLSDWIKDAYKKRGIKKAVIGRDEVDLEATRTEIIVKIIIEQVAINQNKDDTQD